MPRILRLALMVIVGFFVSSGAAFLETVGVLLVFPSLRDIDILILLCTLFVANAIQIIALQRIFVRRAKSRLAKSRALQPEDVQ